jgi:hypothetical protein
MDSSTDRSAEIVPVTLDPELRQVREAIALVASGGARRATVVGLRLGDALLDRARRDALEAGVRVVPLWRADEDGVDIAIERIEP